MEIVIQLIALLIALGIAATRSFRLEAGGLSNFELNRLADEGDEGAKRELVLRPLLPAMEGLIRLKVALLVALLALLLFTTNEAWLAFVLMMVYLLIARTVTAKGWLGGLSDRFYPLVESYVMAVAKLLGPVLIHLSSRNPDLADFSPASRQDLERLIANDEQVLTPKQKARLLGALSLGDLTVADAMVLRDKIVTVKAGETVGPKLLDELHRSGKNVIPVIKRDVDNIQGLLYLHDIMEGHPDIKTVKDALRPSVHYIAGKQPLSAVLVASLQSGRQLFIVVDDNGNTQGLVTLRDALEKLMGTPPPAEIYTSTDPQKVKK